MKDVIIACAGSFAIEAYAEILSINYERQIAGKEEAFRCLGFLSDVPVDLEAKGIHKKILGTIKDWQPSPDEYYFVGLSKPEQKMKVANLLAERGAKFTNIVSPYAILYSEKQLGTGCLVTGASRISMDVEIGNFVNVHVSMIGAGTRIGDFSTTTGYSVLENARIGKGVFIGSKAVVTGGCTVGDWAGVYAGSVVMDDVPPHTNVFGMPARPM